MIDPNQLQYIIQALRGNMGTNPQSNPAFQQPFNPATQNAPSAAKMGIAPSQPNPWGAGAMQPQQPTPQGATPTAPTATNAAQNANAGAPNPLTPSGGPGLFGMPPPTPQSVINSDFSALGQ